MKTHKKPVPVVGDTVTIDGHYHLRNWLYIVTHVYEGEGTVMVKPLCNTGIHNVMIEGYNHPTLVRVANVTVVQLHQLGMLRMQIDTVIRKTVKRKMSDGHR